MEEIKVEVPEGEKPQVVVPKKRGKGRPPKSDIKAITERKKSKPGPHPGDAARIQEFKARLLATGGTRIIDKMVEIAMNDEHPGQMAAIKLSLERLLPVSLFEASKAGGNTPSITINIEGLSGPKIETVEDITDVQVRAIEDE